MNIDLAVKAIAAIAGLVCGLTQTYMNGKTLYQMANANKTTEESSESTKSQEEGV